MADTERKATKPVLLSPKAMLSAALNSGPSKKRPSAFPAEEQHEGAAQPEEKAKVAPKVFKKPRTGKGWSSSDEDATAQEAAKEGFKKPGKQEGSAQETMKSLKHRMRQSKKEEGADQESREAMKEKEWGERRSGEENPPKEKDSSPKKSKDEGGAAGGKKQPPKKTPSRSAPKKSASRSEASQQEPREPPPTWWKKPGSGGDGPGEMFNKPFPQTLAAAAAMAAAGGSGSGPGGDARHAAAAAMATAHAAAAASADASRAAHVMKALQQRQVCWQGRVKHKMENSLVELFHLAAAIPAELAEQFPPALYVSELRHRSEVVLSKHTWARCAAKTLSEKQAAKLQLLSDNKLVAIVRLQHCELILVPDLDQSTGAIRMAGFLLSNSIY